MAKTHGTFVWYELMTTDADAAQAFYADVIGWNIVDAQMPNMDYRMCAGEAGGVSGIMQLPQEMLDGGAQPAWLGYIAVDDADAAVQAFVAAGGTAHVPVTEIPQVGRFATLADPQGVAVCIIELASDEDAPAYDESAIGHCAWNELSTPDQDGGIAFFAKQFGWERGESIDMGAMGSYQIMTHAGNNIAGVMSTFAGGPPSMWRYYYRVPALAPAIEKIRGAGGTVLQGPQEVPGDDEIVVALDPQRAMFCLVAARG